MIPLSLKVKPAGTLEGIQANVRKALALGLPEFSPGLVAHDGHMVIVGSGPSMPSMLDEIRAERERGRPIFAVKGAHDYLCQHGIEPDLFLCVDPRDRTNQLLYANDRTHYLISSRCDETMFTALKSRKVTLVHTWAPEEHCAEYTGKVLVGGGTTSGLRAITVSYVMGFRHIILYGFDSCLDKDRATKRFTGEQVEEKKVIPVIVNGRRFYCNGAMAQQANEFQDYYKVMPDLKVEAKGNGLIAEIIKARKERNFPA